MLFHPHQAISLCPPLLPCHASLSRPPYFPSQLPIYTIRPARLRNVARISHLPSKPTSKNPDKSRQTTIETIATTQLPAPASRLFAVPPPPRIFLRSVQSPAPTHPPFVRWDQIQSEERRGRK